MTDLADMNHLGFIAASYAIGVLLPAVFAVSAWTRMARAARRLDAIDPRRRRAARRRQEAGE
ncbi:MAG: heme exporter protein CcmD [Proteobacteria bacterium]|nr:heme exporter protein CcmD [Pseudomonadota bacterium]